MVLSFASSWSVVFDAFDERHLTTLAESLINGDEEATSAPSGDPSPGKVIEDEHGPYEFVMFLLWYMFLVICCVLPTFCAYRRRRLMEQGFTEQQQATLDRLREQNFLVISNVRVNEAEIQMERTKWITEELQKTTFTVKASDIKENNERTVESIRVDAEVGAVLDVDAIDSTLLTLPPDSRRTTSSFLSKNEPKSELRTVSGGCAICLCPYEEGDVVTWSPKETCSHAFHKECIVPWLSKKNEPHCPCCRQEFCTLFPLPEHAQHQLGLMTPFGLIPTAHSTSLNQDGQPSRWNSLLGISTRRSANTTNPSTSDLSTHLHSLNAASLFSLRLPHDSPIHQSYTVTVVNSIDPELGSPNQAPEMEEMEMTTVSVSPRPGDETVQPISRNQTADEETQDEVDEANDSNNIDRDNASDERTSPDSPESPP